MANNSLIYTNARVKTLENTLLSSEKISRLVNSENIDEGVKILIESGYGGALAIQNNEFELILQAENDKLCDFLRESMPSGVGLETFLMTNDFHNAKALVKAKYMHLTDAEFMLQPDGLIQVSEMKDKIFADNYNAFSPVLRKALIDIDNLRVAGDKSPRIIDCIIDKAMYQEILTIAAKGKNKNVVQYWKASVDMCNILNFVRCKKIGVNFEFFMQSFVENGTWDKDFFEKSYEFGTAEFVDKIRYSEYSGTLLEALASNNVTLFEKRRDDYCQDIFSKDKNDIFSVSPLAGYFVAKKTEIKVVRMILILLKINADKALIKERLREFYA